MRNTRKLSGIAGKIESVLLIVYPIMGIVYVLDLPSRIGIILFTEQYVGIFITLFLSGTFLSIPGSKAGPHETVPWYDWIIAGLAFPGGLYLAINYPKLVLQLSEVTVAQVVCGGLTILLILEALRRQVGWSLVIVVGGLILYARLAVYGPAFLGGRPVSTERLINYLYLDPNSTLWMVMLAATIGLAFVFFGQVMIHFGGGQSLTDLATVLCGRMRGGSAKTAVVASSLVGTITGAPMSNVFLTGSISIPMMINSGFKRHIAAAVESVASSGGQIMPPVMGIAAFIMAEYIGVSYAEVALAALFPALLYYLAIFLQVDIEAGKEGILGLGKDEIPPVRPTLKNAIVPALALLILVYTIFIMRLSPAYAATISGILCLPVFGILPANRKDFFEKLINSLVGTGRLLLVVGGVMSAAGLVVGAINVSGMGFSISYILSQIGQGSVFLMLLGAAIASMILGMGMPSVAAYALVAILIAPALVNFGILPIAAHLFIFYFAIISNFTPPIALCCFAAAPLAKTNPMRVGLSAMRLGIMSYVVPFLFVFSPTMLLKGPLYIILGSVSSAILGVFFLSVALSGYLFELISFPRRAILCIGALATIVPFQPENWNMLFLNLAGIALSVGSLWPESRLIKEKLFNPKNKIKNVSLS
jgi:TRAP transporter 4TM/12TM fusion protein